MNQKDKRNGRRDRRRQEMSRNGRWKRGWRNGTAEASAFSARLSAGKGSGEDSRLLRNLRKPRSQRHQELQQAKVPVKQENCLKTYKRGN